MKFRYNETDKYNKTGSMFLGLPKIPNINLQPSKFDFVFEKTTARYKMNHIHHQYLINVYTNNKRLGLFVIL